jgi:transcriptional antiterminator RfaH
VARLVCQGEHPAIVAAGVVEGLKRRENEEGFVRLDQRPTFALGAPVRILDGVFATCVGLFDGLTDHQRVAILLDLLGHKVRVVLDDLSLAAA